MLFVLLGWISFSCVFQVSSCGSCDVLRGRRDGRGVDGKQRGGRTGDDLSRKDNLANGYPSSGIGKIFSYFSIYSGPPGLLQDTTTGTLLLRRHNSDHQDASLSLAPPPSLASAATSAASTTDHRSRGRGWSWGLQTRVPPPRACLSSVRVILG